MTEDAGGQNLTVAVRLRPLNKREEQKKVAKKERQRLERGQHVWCESPAS